MISGDIELNPGPVQKDNSQAGITLPSHLVLQQRLQHFQLRPLDVGGAGDCFFRAVSHQLYGDPSHHLAIRAAGIAYMRENPERFIESNTEYSWGQYLNSMSMQGTWCDGLIIQAVADQLNLRILIAQSNEHFAQFNMIQAVTPLQPPTDIYLGHIDEYHYVSTLPCSTISHIPENQHTDVDKIEQNVLARSLLPDQNVKKSQNIFMNYECLNKTSSYKQKKNAYMKEYMKRKRLTEDPQVKQKNNDYIRNI